MPSLPPNHPGFRSHGQMARFDQPPKDSLVDRDLGYVFLS